MASQTRSQLSLPDDVVTVLPGKTTMKPSPTALAIVSVTPTPSNLLLVDTVSRVDPATTGDDTRPSASVSTGTTIFFVTTPAFASASATRTTKDSAENEDDDKVDPNNKKPIPFLLPKHLLLVPPRILLTMKMMTRIIPTKKKNNKKQHDKSGTAVPLPTDDFSTLDCRFIFDVDPARPLLAEIFNISYDPSFDPKFRVNFDSSLQNDSNLVLRNEMRYIFSHQAITIGPSTDDSYVSSTCQLIIKTITESFTFVGDLVKCKGLIKSPQSLQHISLHAKRQRFQSFLVYIFTVRLHLVDESGFLLPPKHWDPLNLGHFIEPNSHSVLNSLPSICVDDVLP